MKWIIGIIAILLILVACEDTPTDSPYYHNASMEGYVQFSNAQTDSVSADVEVYLHQDTEVTLVAELTTDQDGYWYVDGLAVGEYYIYFTAQEYGSTNVTINLADTNTTTVDTVVFEVYEPPVPPVPVDSLQFVSISVDSDSTDWTIAPWEQNDHASNWGPNDFTTLYMGQSSTHLYICITGNFSADDNTVNVYIDKDFGDSTGVNDFSVINGGDPGNRLRKNVVTPDYFGADLAFCNWALSDTYFVSLDFPEAVDSNTLEASVSMSSSCIEIAIPFEVMFGTENAPDGQPIALVAIIGGGGDAYFADDSLPQQDNVASFQTVVGAMLSE